MIPYDEVAKKVFAYGKIRDGYFGGMKRVGFALIPYGSYSDPNPTRDTGPFMIIVVHESGYYGAGLPPVVDEQEAAWVLTNRPYSKGKPMVISGKVEMKEG